jgi:hypothetical protein
MASRSTPLAARPATGLRPQRHLELTPTPYSDMSRMFENMLTAITRLPLTIRAETRDESTSDGGAGEKTAPAGQNKPAKTSQAEAAH